MKTNSFHNSRQSCTWFRAGEVVVVLKKPSWEKSETERAKSTRVGCVNWLCLKSECKIQLWENRIWWISQMKSGTVGQEPNKVNRFEFMGWKFLDLECFVPTFVMCSEGRRRGGFFLYEKYGSVGKYYVRIDLSESILFYQESRLPKIWNHKICESL